MTQLVFFDFFGVFMPDPMRSWRALRNLEPTPELTEITLDADLGRISSDEFFTRLAAAANFSPEEVRQDFASVEAIDPGLITLIDSLRADYRVGLISNSSVDYLQTILDVHQLTPLFNPLIISAEVKAVKPEPEIFTAALTQAQVAAADAFFIDDRPENISGARAVGIDGVVFSDVAQLQLDLRTHGIIS